MRLYTPLEEYMDWLSSKQRVYEKYPLWWKFKNLVTIVVVAFLLLGAGIPSILVRLEIMEANTAAPAVFLSLGIGLGCIFTVGMIDDILIKQVKE